MIHDCYRQTLGSNVLNTKLENTHVFRHGPEVCDFGHKKWREKLKYEKHISVLICWKFEYKPSLLPNYLEIFQVYSSYSIVCPTLNSKLPNIEVTVIIHTQIPFFFNPIVWTWSSLLFLGISDFKLVRFTQPDIGQIYLAWQLLTKNGRLNSFNMTHSGLLVGLHIDSYSG